MAGICLTARCLRSIALPRLPAAVGVRTWRPLRPSVVRIEFGKAAHSIGNLQRAQIMASPKVKFGAPAPEGCVAGQSESPVRTDKAALLCFAKIRTLSSREPSHGCCTAVNNFGGCSRQASAAEYATSQRRATMNDSFTTPRGPGGNAYRYGQCDSGASHGRGAEGQFWTSWHADGHGGDCCGALGRTPLATIRPVRTG